MFFRKRSSFSEQDLDSVLTACLAGEAQAQRTLFRQFYSYAKSVCLRYAASAEEAEEVLNDSFLKVFQRLHQYDRAYAFKGWLRAIVINTAISYHRKYHKLDTVAGLEAGMDATFDESVVDRIAAEEILAMVQQLPPSHRTVFSLHVVDGYSLREIADMLESNEATIRSQFMRARRRLQEMIRAAHPDFRPREALESAPVFTLN
ncbi:RNA polymerase sigma factor [Tellurirhabdus rosea]|uniref:RNA polymerase sigma factor n=1 Tax=Tellurirhabdus rosea TaxID=2674997 RepID=UPI0022582207|nr:RNA polymerase sigma factor [Tellurirhabdus rosea]